MNKNELTLRLRDMALVSTLVEFWTVTNVMVLKEHYSTSLVIVKT